MILPTTQARYTQEFPPVASPYGTDMGKIQERCQAILDLINSGKQLSRKDLKELKNEFVVLRMAILEHERSRDVVVCPAPIVDDDYEEEVIDNVYIDNEPDEEEEEVREESNEENIRCEFKKEEGWYNPLPFGPKRFSNNQMIVIAGATVVIAAVSVYFGFKYFKSETPQSQKPKDNETKTDSSKKEENKPEVKTDATKKEENKPEVKTDATKKEENKSEVKTDSSKKEEKKAEVKTNATKKEENKPEVKTDPTKKEEKKVEQSNPPSAATAQPSYKYSWTDIFSFSSAVVNYCADWIKNYKQHHRKSYDQMIAEYEFFKGHIKGMLKKHSLEYLVKKGRISLALYCYIRGGGHLNHDVNHKVDTMYQDLLESNQVIVRK